MYKYIDLINQTFDFPTEDFHVENGYMTFNDIPLMDLIKEHGTPLKISYLPKISSQIQKAKKLFNEAIEKLDYKGTYTYCYCTKSSHFSFVLEEALKNNIHIETSSAFDIPIARALFEKGKIDKNTFIICNGFKVELYKKYISEMINDGFVNCLPVLDNISEIQYYKENVYKNCNLAIRLASDEEPKFEFYTSRLGISYNDVIDFYLNEIKTDSKFKLTMLHYFINSGIKDTSYYWSELRRFVHKYCQLKKVCPELNNIDIGGGFPIKTSIHFDYNYQYMAEEIVRTVQRICKEEGVDEPNIFTEFGIFTVGESAATIYSILDQKLQNDKELWYMIDGSFITNLPDTWALNQRYILLAINNLDKDYQKVQLGGLTCDSQDYYNSEMHSFQVFLPKIQDEKLYIGFFHTGAYQESLSGYGGTKHCLIPAPKHIIVDKNEKGELKTWVFAEQQTSESMLKVLGYK